MKEYLVLGVDLETSNTFFCGEGYNEFESVNRGFSDWLRATPPPSLYGREEAEKVKRTLQESFGDSYRYLVVEASEEYLDIVEEIREKRGE